MMWHQDVVMLFRRTTAGPGVLETGLSNLPSRVQNENVGPLFKKQRKGVIKGTQETFSFFL